MKRHWFHTSGLPDKCDLQVISAAMNRGNVYWSNKQYRVYAECGNLYIGTPHGGVLVPVRFCQGNLTGPLKLSDFFTSGEGGVGIVRLARSGNAKRRPATKCERKVIARLVRWLNKLGHGPSTMHEGERWEIEKLGAYDSAYGRFPSEYSDHDLAYRRMEICAAIAWYAVCEIWRGASTGSVTHEGVTYTWD